jgi:integrase
MRQRLERFLAYLGDSPALAELTTARVDAFLSSLVDLRTVQRSAGSGETELEPDPGTPAKGSTVNRYRAVIGGFCTWLVRTNRLARHPIAGKRVQKRPEPHHRLPELSADDYRDYMVVVRRDRPDLAIIFLLLLHTGADVGEVFMREARDVDLDRSSPRIRYQRTKTERFAAANRPRFVPMPPNLVEEMRAHLAEHQLRGAEQLFAMFARRDVETTHARAARAIKRDELTLKDLRHIAAISWARAGVGIRTIARYLGHTSLAMTMRYTDYEPDVEAEAEAIERAALTLTRTIGVTPLRPRADDSSADSYAPKNNTLAAHA